MANTTLSASLWAPTRTPQIMSGLRTVNSTTRACNLWSSLASFTAMNPVIRKAVRVNICSQNTVLCMFSPPSTEARYWEYDATGPYTLGVSCQGRSVQISTGS